MIFVSSRFDDEPRAFEVNRRAPYTPADIRMGRRRYWKAMASELKIEAIARMFSFSESYVRAEIAALDSPEGEGPRAEAVAGPRTMRRLRTPSLVRFRWEQIRAMWAGGMTPSEIALYWHATPDYIRKLLARPAPDR